MHHMYLSLRVGLWESNHLCVPIVKSRHYPLPLYKFLIWILLGVLTFPCCVRCLIFKVGVLGPWNCDPVYSRALPGMAARLAVGRINQDSSLVLGRKMDFIVLQEPCETSQALTTFLNYEKVADAFVGPTNTGFCSAANLLATNWDKAIFSYGCVNYELDQDATYPTFARTLPPPFGILFAVLKYFQWANVGIVSSNEDIWMEAAVKLANALRREGLPVGIVTSMGINETEVERTMKRIQAKADLKVIIMCMHSALIGGQQQTTFLLKALELGLTQGQYVFLPYDALLYSLPYGNVSYAPLKNSSRLRQAYDAVLTVTVESEDLSFYQALDAATQSGGLPASLEPLQVHPLFGTIYNSIYLLAKSIHSARQTGTLLSGSNLAYLTRNRTFDGFNQKVRVSADGTVTTNYVILDMDGVGSQLYSTYTLDPASGNVRFAGRNINFPGGSPPASDSLCWFDKTVTCTGGVEIIYIVVIFVVIAILAIVGIALTLFIRDG
ncbi:unnamed protein product [Arctogadus glacialis]